MDSPLTLNLSEIINNNNNNDDNTQQPQQQQQQQQQQPQQRRHIIYGYGSIQDVVTDNNNKQNNHNDDIENNNDEDKNQTKTPTTGQQSILYSTSIDYTNIMHSTIAEEPALSSQRTSYSSYEFGNIMRSSPSINHQSSSTNSTTNISHHYSHNYDDDSDDDDDDDEFKPNMKKFCRTLGLELAGWILLLTILLGTVFWDWTSSSSSDVTSSSSTMTDKNNPTTTTKMSKQKKRVSYKPFSTRDVPFPSVRRSEYGDDGGSVLDFDLLSSDLKSTVSSSHRYSSRRLTTATNSDNDNDSDDPTLASPLPTGAFWTNFILKTSSSYPVVVYPYAHQFTHSSLTFCYPPHYRRYNTPTNPIKDEFHPDLSLSMVEDVSRRFVTRYDDLSVTLEWRSAENDDDDDGDDASVMTAYLVTGSPYVTMEYMKATPVLELGGSLMMIRNVTCLNDVGSCYAYNDDDDDGAETFVHGTIFHLELSGHDGKVQNWILFSVATETTTTASNDVIFYLSSDRRRLISKNVFDNVFDGVLRLALVPEGEGAAVDNNMIDGSLVQQLILRAGIYPTGGTVSLSYAKTHFMGHYDTAIIKYSYTAAGDTESNLGLLTLSLPHHQHTTKTKTTKRSNNDGVYQTVKGPMTIVVGDSWIYRLPLPSLDPFNDGSINDDHLRSIIQRQIEIDWTMVRPTAKDVYGFGKEVARMAQLALISRRLESNGDDDDDATLKTTTTTKILGVVAEALSEWFDNPENLVYDEDLGGIVTVDGLMDDNADFGNGWYNDHHFHYGYLIYASTILSYYNSTFLSLYSTHVESLIYDIANPPPLSSSFSSSSHDTHDRFPPSRHKSWYDGHSWASGLFPMADGKSQESVSEAVNAYYAVYLWCRFIAGDDDGASDDEERTLFARTLLGTEIVGAKMYWQIDNPSVRFSDGSHSSSNNDNQTSSPISNVYMLANIGMLDVSSSTWFGTNVIYTHMINFMPVTDVTTFLFSPDYVTLERQHVLDHVTITKNDEAWRGYLVCNEAIVNASKAWMVAMDMDGGVLDAGLSKSEVLFWIGRGERARDVNWEVIVGESGGGGMVGTCVENHKCFESGLTVGLCCPTKEGVFLNCCNDKQKQRHNDGDDNGTMIQPSSSSCRSHSGCASLNGDCCPTNNGIFLGCCSVSSSDSTTTTNENGTTNDIAAAVTPLSSSSLCDSHPSCQALSLGGNCCPTDEGLMLGCCNGDDYDNNKNNNNDVRHDNDDNTPSSGGGDTTTTTNSCQTNHNCAILGLDGSCCPTTMGSFLGCCDAMAAVKDDDDDDDDESSLKKKSNDHDNDVATAGGDAASCDYNSKCAALNLEGDCCPTAAGIYLGCCHDR